MSYTALYRKYRPDTFSGLIGQEAIVTTLRNQIKSGRVSHAYLFSGTRGTGKTSSAKIFARAINCLNKTEDGEPCNKCSQCLAILENRSVNVIEIDAASNNGVDNIREIREEVKYPPTEGVYKVYIIDEVHMLSSGAFNALLKTLEEPPEHVIFILATTDPQKVPQTILSRCQRFDFRRITTKDISDTLSLYLEEERQSIDKDAIDYIARLGDGSMRDSLSILDKSLAFFSGRVVTLEMVLDITGAVDDNYLFDLSMALVKKDSQLLLELVEKMISQGRQVKQFVWEYIIHLRNLLIVITVDNISNIVDISNEKKQKFLSLKNNFSVAYTINLIERFSALQNDMKYSSNDRIMLEVELLRICLPSLEADNNSLVARMERLEKDISNGANVNHNVQCETKPAEDKDFKKPVAVKKSLVIPNEQEEIIKKWDKEKGNIIKTLSNPLKGYIRSSNVAFKNDGRLYLLSYDYVAKAKLNREREKIEEIVNNLFDKNFEIDILDKKEYDEWLEDNNYSKVISEAGVDLSEYFEEYELR